MGLPIHRGGKQAAPASAAALSIPRTLDRRLLVFPVLAFLFPLICRSLHRLSVIRLPDLGIQILNTSSSVADATGYQASQYPVCQCLCGRLSCHELMMGAHHAH